ncbi:hypothetical protein F4825DRAFT_458318 [Nemania diffusa]|nr:hypothetical protein F4825DRAFT_458318 [Nemania diffusa]
MSSTNHPTRVETSQSTSQSASQSASQDQSPDQVRDQLIDQVEDQSKGPPKTLSTPLGPVRPPRASQGFEKGPFGTPLTP